MCLIVIEFLCSSLSTPPNDADTIRQEPIRFLRISSSDSFGATSAAAFSSADEIGTATPQPTKVNAVITTTKKQFNRIERPFGHESKTE
jgi:hypothetical protein